MNKLLRRLRAPLPAAVLAAVVTAGVTMGAVALAAGSDVFYACEKANGDIKATTMRRNTPPTCGANETVVSWNAEGPTGPAGTDGQDGAPGPGTTRLQHEVTAGNGIDSAVLVTSPPCPAGSKAVSGGATPYPTFNASLFQISEEGAMFLDGERWAVFYGTTQSSIPLQQFRVTVECEVLP
jgi:hypothetical protein